MRLAGASDENWLRRVAPNGWTIIGRDVKIYERPDELAAYRLARVQVFLLPSMAAAPVRSPELASGVQRRHSDDGRSDQRPGDAKDGPVPADREEPNRVLGMPRRTVDPHGRQDEEQRRAFGVPVDRYRQLDWAWLRSLRHPVEACKRWRLRRRLGPFAP
jgi:hypothetical protein